MENQPIVNKVANSPLRTLDLEDYIPSIEKETIDLAEFLFQRMILKEKEFRQSVKDLDIAFYKGKAVRVFCSEDVIIPSWAYMLIVSALSPLTYTLVMGDNESLERAIIDQAIDQIPIAEYENQKLVIKGCGGIKLRDYTYFQVTKKVLPHVSSLMYGEPCSTVPIFKKKK